MKKYTLIVAFIVAATLPSCVPIDPNWSPQQKAQVQNANANMVMAGGVAALGAAADIYALKSHGYGYGHRYGHGYGYGYGYNPFFGY